MKKLFYPLAPLFTGIFIGVLVSLLVIMQLFAYTLGTIRSGEWSTHSGPVRAIGEQIRAGVQQYQSTSVYGHIVTIGNGTLVLDTNGAMGPKTYTFIYDDATTVVRLNNDDESTEIPIQVSDLTPGTGVTVLTEESIGGSEGLRIVKLIQL